MQSFGPISSRTGAGDGVCLCSLRPLGLALMGWLTSTTAHGQVEAGLPGSWMSLRRMHIPVGALGMEPTLVQGQGIEAVWSPRLDLIWGPHPPSIERWMDLGGGLEWIRREHDIVVAYNNDSLGWSVLDTLPACAVLAYRIPFLGGIRFPLGGMTLKCNRALGSPWNGRPARPL